MKSNEPLESTLRKLRYQRAAQRRDKSLAHVVAAFDESNRATPPARRIFLASKLAKLAVAAAIVVTAGFLWRVSVGTSKAYALSDVPHLVRQARTLHTGTRFYNGDHELEIEVWADLENGRYCSTQEYLAGADGSESPQEVKYVRSVVCDGQYIMRTDERTRTATFERLLLSQAEPMRQIMASQISAQTLDDIGNFDQYAKVDEGRIDGDTYDIWRRELKSPTSGDHRVRYEYWISPTTGAVGRMTFWFRHGDDQPWQLSHEMKAVEIDVEPPAGIFATESPAGYRLDNDKATADVLSLDMPFDDAQAYTLRVAASFVFADGSVLVGWRGLHDTIGAGPDALYEGLEFGGDLPRAPIEIFALTAPVDEGASSRNVQLVGRHVATTRKAGRVYEWSLYVPQQPVPVDSTASACYALVRTNVERSAIPEGGLPPVICFAVTRQGFSQYVLPGMRELSDDGVLPAEVDYDELLLLASQTRGRSDLYAALDQVIADGYGSIGSYQSVDPSEITTPERADQEARGLVAAFCAAIVDGRDSEAAGMLAGDESRALGVVAQMRQLPGLGDIAGEDVYAAEESALVVTSEFEVSESRRGRLAISVVRQEGLWRIRDFDATTTETMQVEVQKYLESFPQAEHFGGP